MSGWVAGIVRSNVIEHWEGNDEQTHLRTMRDRVLSLEAGRRREVLGIYGGVLERGSVVVAEDGAEQMALRLSGLVVKRDGGLVGYNRIYGEVFGADWVSAELGKLCPFAEQLGAWVGDRDSSRLLRGQALVEAWEWVFSQRNIPSQNIEFLQQCGAVQEQEIQVLNQKLKKLYDHVVILNEDLETQVQERVAVIGQTFEELKNEIAKRDSLILNLSTSIKDIMQITRILRQDQNINLKSQNLLTTLEAHCAECVKILK